MTPPATTLRLPAGARPPVATEGGAALMLSLLVLLVLVAVVFQINIATTTDARVTRNDIALTTMDLAIESALLDVYEQLIADFESDASSASESAAGGNLAGILGGQAGVGSAGGLGGLGAGQMGGGPTDSRREDWARPQRTEINGVSLRILIEDESRKLNVLGLLTENPDEAEKVFQRVVRVIDLFREGTEGDVSAATATEAVRVLRDHLERRRDSRLPRVPLVTDDPAKPDRGMPLTLRELVVLSPFEASWFRDERDSNDRIMHGLERYLTIWSSLDTLDALVEARGGAAGTGGLAGGGGGGGGAGGGRSGGGGGGAGGAAGSSGGGGGGSASGTGPQGTGGATGTAGGSSAAAGQAGALLGGGGGGRDDLAPAWRVNVNTAPGVVLKSLTDDRDVHPRFWDQVIEHRNEEDETQRDPTADPVLDEYGEEIIVHKIFPAPEAVGQLPDWTRIDPKLRQEILNHIGVRSEVFTIYVTARIDTDPSRSGGYGMSRAEQERYEDGPGHLVRTVRCVVWRRQSGDKVEIVPIQRWKLLDHRPLEILDFPEDDR